MEKENEQWKVDPAAEKDPWDPLESRQGKLRQTLEDWWFCVHFLVFLLCLLNLRKVWRKWGDYYFLKFTKKENSVLCLTTARVVSMNLNLFFSVSRTIKKCTQIHIRDLKSSLCLLISIEAIAVEMLVDM